MDEVFVGDNITACCIASCCDGTCIDEPADDGLKEYNLGCFIVAQGPWCGGQGSEREWRVEGIGKQPVWVRGH